MHLIDSVLCHPLPDLHPTIHRAFRHVHDQDPSHLYLSSALSTFQKPSICIYNVIPESNPWRLIDVDHCSCSSFLLIHMLKTSNHHETNKIHFVVLLMPLLFMQQMLGYFY